MEIIIIATAFLQVTKLIVKEPKKDTLVTGIN